MEERRRTLYLKWTYRGGLFVCSMMDLRRGPGVPGGTPKVFRSSVTNNSETVTSRVSQFDVTKDCGGLTRGLL
eukprot:3933804-Rhodomonas_salina.1